MGRKGILRGGPHERICCDLDLQFRHACTSAHGWFPPLIACRCCCCTWFSFSFGVQWVWEISCQRLILFGLDFFLRSAKIIPGGLHSIVSGERCIECTDYRLRGCLQKLRNLTYLQKGFSWLIIRSLFVKFGVARCRFKVFLNQVAAIESNQ